MLFLWGYNVVDKAYKFKHLYSALISARHRISICPIVLLFQLTKSHNHWSVSRRSPFLISAKEAGDCRIKVWQPSPFHLAIPRAITWCNVPRSIQLWTLRHFSSLFRPVFYLSFRFTTGPPQSWFFFSFPIEYLFCTLCQQRPASLGPFRYQIPLNFSEQAEHGVTCPNEPIRVYPCHLLRTDFCME